MQNKGSIVGFQIMYLGTMGGRGTPMVQEKMDGMGNRGEEKGGRRKRGGEGTWKGEWGNEKQHEEGTHGYHCEIQQIRIPPLIEEVMHSVDSTDIMESQSIPVPQESNRGAQTLSNFFGHFRLR